MKTLDEALEACHALELPRRSERLELNQAAGRYLTAPMIAPHDAPRWALSAMDGYAVAWAHSPAERYRVTQVIAAGHAPQALAAGQAARIMTGAPLPSGADTVIIQEDVEEGSLARAGEGGEITLVSPPRGVGENVRQRAEELAQGELLLDIQTALSSADLALAASQGLKELSVWARPRVAILSTGDELCEPGAALKVGQIYASNATLLKALVEEAGAEAIDCGVARDTPSSTREGFERALAVKPDVIISTGGVSVGDFDPVRGVLAELGVRLDFWKVKMKPGKPLAVGALGGVPLLALPGNPVSAAVSFCLFAWPLLRRALGAPLERAELPRLTLPLGEALTKRHQRAELMRVRSELEPDSSGRLRPSWRLSGGQSSAWLSPLARSEALLLIPEGPVSWERGRSAEALALPWAWERLLRLSQFNELMR